MGGGRLIPNATVILVSRDDLEAGTSGESQRLETAFEDGLRRFGVLQR